jgi:hypothetical protein
MSHEWGKDREVFTTSGAYPWSFVTQIFEFEDTKGVIRIRIWKNNRQHNCQKKKIQKDKQRSAIETKHTHQTKDRVTRTLLKARGECRCSGRVGSSCCTSGTCRVNLVTNSEHIRGHLYNRYSVTVNQVMVVIVKLSKWLCGMLWFLFYYFTMKH